jgi:hypothetical protein
VAVTQTTESNKAEVFEESDFTLWAFSHRTLLAIRWQYDDDTMYATGDASRTPEAIYSDYILQ